MLYLNPSIKSMIIHYYVREEMLKYKTMYKMIFTWKSFVFKKYKKVFKKKKEDK